MKSILCIGLIVLLSLSAFAQDNRVVQRIKIRHADPQLIAMLLSGQTTVSTPPEMSTFVGGFGNGFGGGFGNGFGGSNAGGGFGGFNSGFGGASVGFGGNRGVGGR
jgi:uncharacterized membrane protein YgcG